jgi:hypothetical protein
MKLCPQCDFIYEDDQTVCDMDGKALVFEPTLTAFSGNSAVEQTVPVKHAGFPRFRRLAVAAMAGLALGATVVLCYYVVTDGDTYANAGTAPTSTSNPIVPGPKKSASPAALATPLAYGSSPFAVDPGSADPHTAKADLTSDADQQPHQHAVSSADGSVMASISPEGAVTQAATAKASPSLSISALPRVAPLPTLKPLRKLESPKAARRTVIATASQTPARMKQNKESRFGSFIKKTAQILKKPFKS